MSSKNKNQKIDEIDLIDIMITVWSNKWKIILISIMASVVMFIYVVSKPPAEVTFKASTKIRPISTFDEFEYEGYNNYLKNTTLENIFYSLNPSPYLDKKDLEKDTNNKAFIYTRMDTSSFYRIDKTYLFDLFIDKLDENSLFINAIQEYELIKKEDFNNNEEYEDATKKLASSIKLVNNRDDKNEFDVEIHFQTNNKEAWEKTLKYFEESTNLEIKNYLNETFNKLIVNLSRLKEYKLEDIDIIKSNMMDNKNYVDQLEKLKNNLQESRNIIRLQDAFKSTPVIESNNFYAARIMVDTTKYKENISNSYNLIPLTVTSSLIGLIIGIFYVLIASSIRSRSN